MEFGILGPVEVTVTGRPVSIGNAQQRAVLAVFLLDVNQPISPGRLIERVWGDAPPAGARKALYGYVARLRRALAGIGDPGTVLARGAGGYVLSTDPGQLDLSRFRQHVTVAGDDDARAEALQLAIGLWRGEALAGLSSPWLAAMRSALELQRIAAILDLNDIALRRGQHDALISELTGQAAARPANERLAGQLMLALYRSGRQADALQRFEQIRKQLTGEYGADPGPELQSLHQQILRGDPALRRIEAVSLRPGPVPRQLPADVSAFTGREAELRELSWLLRDSRTGGGSAGPGPGAGPQPAALVCAVCGTAGVGKTALALRWAHRVVGRFPDGQLYVNLRGYDTAQPVPATEALAGFLRALGVSGQAIPAGLDERTARYRSLLAGRRMLVVLDNASDADQVRPLLPGTAACLALITSRDALPGLVTGSGVRRLDLGVLPLADAVGLIRRLIGARAGENRRAAEALAEQCARLPLALRIAAELAAAHPATPLADLVQQLADQQDRLDLLQAGGDVRTAIRAVFSWSWRHLGPGTARAFRLLGLHPGPDFDAYAAAALTGTTLGEARPFLDQLAQAHLIQVTGAGRYDMHDLLRSYARDLATQDEGETGQRDALTRLFDHYLHTCSTAMDVLYPAEQGRRPRVPRPASPQPLLSDPVAARAWLDAERAVLVAVTSYLARNGWTRHVVELAAVLSRYLETGGHFPEALIIHQHARDAASAARDGQAEASALTSLGSIDFRQGRLREAAAHYRRALTMSRDAGDQAGEARARHNLGLTELGLGRDEQASAAFEAALPLYQAAGDRLGEARTLSYLGFIDLKRGQCEQAISRETAARAALREVGDRRGEAGALARLGLAELRLRRLPAAIDHLEQALILCRELGDRVTEADALVTLGDAQHHQGDGELAAAALQQALVLFRETGNQPGEARARNALGDVSLAADQAAPARVHHAAALSLAGLADDQEEQARAHSGLADGYFRTGSPDQARDHWRQALALWAGLGAPEADEVRAKLAAAGNGSPASAGARRAPSDAGT